MATGHHKEVVCEMEKPVYKEVAWTVAVENTTRVAARQVFEDWDKPPKAGEECFERLLTERSAYDGLNEHASWLFVVQYCF